MLVKVLSVAVKRFPQFNASIDAEADEIVYKKYVNVGVAVDTDRGLLRAGDRNADQKNLTQIAIELHQLAQKARDRKLTLEEMSGGGITISIWAGSAHVHFTPIINWPEVAILGVSRGIIEPVWRVQRRQRHRGSSRIEASNGHLRAATASAAVALRPSCHRRGGRDAFPSLGCGSGRAAVSAVAPGMTVPLSQILQTGSRWRQNPYRLLLGAGPGGYAAAHHAADLGMKVALIDEEKNPRRRLFYRMHSFEGSSSCSRGHR